jgi:quercetin dioxygenase-like cupin family protein
MTNTQHTRYHIDWKSVPDRTGVSGIPIKLVVGQHMQMTLVELAAGFENQPHSHISEQMGYVLAGTIQYDIEGETITCHPGDGYRIPPNKRHSIKVVSDEPARYLECFSPLRPEYP